MATAPLDDHTLRALEERALNAWPALGCLFVDGWVLRFAGGYTKRANSVNALSPRASVEAIVPVAEPLYAALGLPLIFRLSPLAGAQADVALAAAGFRRGEASLVLTAPLPPGLSPDAAVSLIPAPDTAWLEGVAAALGLPGAKRRLHDRMLAALACPAAFATVRLDGCPVGYGVGVAERGMVGLFDIVTLPEARRRGAARRLVAALFAWGRARGAQAAYLQVLADNRPALALYGQAGFREAYRYHYRIRP